MPAIFGYRKYILLTIYLSPWIGAIQTMEIRSLNEHCLENKHDVQNRERLKQMVYDRARNLKYLRRKDTSRYDQALVDLGLDSRTVEGELKFRT